MVIFSHNDQVMCLTFSVSLKGMASDWFYSLPLHSLHSFAEVTETFLNQYASRQEAKKNSHHFISVRMRQGDSLKLFINFLQNHSPKCLTVERRLPPSHSSVDYKILTICTNIS